MRAAIFIGVTTLVAAAASVCMCTRREATPGAAQFHGDEVGGGLVDGHDERARLALLSS